ncbi:hypothetical protein BC826DRAFT_1104674 [Russula brevipes]|nr:hypothetical protein BC826DRAFT_1104674 [Russula brevipes]
MNVYPWDGIRSSAEGLAIARAVQEKYGPAKEVVFPRDTSSVNNFRTHFWLVFDDPDVRKCLPKEPTRIRIHVADMPRGDGNVGLEEMMRGLGVTDSKDAPRESPPQTETRAPPDDADDAGDPPEGYKTLEVAVELTHRAPTEVFGRKRHVSRSLHRGLVPRFAAAWLAFDGFSPESARGPNTPNLIRAREKWRKLAPVAAASAGDDSLTTTAVADEATSAVPSSEEPVEVGTESPAESETPAREWVPIVLSTPEQRSKSTSISSQQTENNSTTTAAAPPDGHSTPLPTTKPAADAADSDATDAAPAPSTPDRPQNVAPGAHPPSRAPEARTPLPKPAQEPQPPSKAEKLDEEGERQRKEQTIRERLWRLVGGNF